VRDIAQPFAESAHQTFDAALCASLQRVYLTVCGDSYHASVGAELAFHQLAGLPTQAASALTFSRYMVGFLPPTGAGTNLVIAVSVSGVVTRTIEALTLAQQVGAAGVALTGNAESPLARSGQRVFLTTVPPLPDELRGMIVPGVRSYLASQIALYNAAIRIGELRQHITPTEGESLRAELLTLADVMEATIAACEPLCRDLASQWSDADDFVYVGAGPLYGAAMFSAAKLLEGSGDPAMAQETEEWAHLQYFSDRQGTPTILINANGNDADRMAEVARAAQSIERRLAAILPEDEAHISLYVDTVLPVRGSVRECFAPLVYSIPGELLAAERAASLGAQYFRGFGGGRTVPWAEGASRIRDSHMITEVKR
jgi:glucosamine--fructose-6-phosphate aminotransferase (isomerizing)